MKPLNIDLRRMTILELAKLIEDIWREMKQRNPIGINLYEMSIRRAADALYRNW